MKKLLILVSLSIFLLNNIYAKSSRNIQDILNHWRIENEIPGAVLHITHLNNSKSETYFSGSTLLHGKSKVTGNNLFQIGSITKTFVSVIILQLEAEGKLSIDDTLGRWFPEYPRWKDITIRQLLNMSSGIYNYTQGFQIHYRQIKPSELINLAYEKKDYFPAGSDWAYSNTNYILAGELIERVTGHSFSSELNNRILQKYQLNHTFYIPKPYPKDILARMAHGYLNDKDITRLNMSAYGTAGAMISNVYDLEKWTNIIFNQAILPPKQLNEFLTTIPFKDSPPKPKNSRYGLGIYWLNTAKYGDIWWYSGVTEGYISLFAWIPAKKVIITATINHREENHSGMLMPGQALMNQLLTRI